MLTQTTTTLLNSLLNDPPQQAAWRTVYERYGPAVYRFALRHGLNEEQAEEAVAATMAALFEAYRAGRYDRHRGRFRTWVFGIAMNKVRETRRRYASPVSVAAEANLSRATGATAAVTSGVARTDRAPTPDEQFEADVDRALAWQCLDAVRRRVSPLTYQAFDLYVLKDKPARDVARTLGIEVSAVYVAKTRVLSMARKEYERLCEADRET